MGIQNLLGTAVLAAALSLMTTAATAQEQARDLTGQSANVFSARGAALAAASGSGMPATVADFLSTQGHGPATIDSLVIARRGRTTRSELSAP